MTNKELRISCTGVSLSQSIIQEYIGDIMIVGINKAEKNRFEIVRKAFLEKFCKVEKHSEDNSINIYFMKTIKSVEINFPIYNLPDSSFFIYSVTGVNSPKIFYSAGDGLGIDLDDAEIKENIQKLLKDNINKSHVDGT